MTLTVCTTDAEPVLMSEIESLLELATIRVPSEVRVSAVGSSPTGISLISLLVTRSTSDTVPRRLARNVYLGMDADADGG